MHDGESAVSSRGVCLCDQASAAAFEHTCNKNALQGAVASEAFLSQAAVFEFSSDDVLLELRTNPHYQQFKIWAGIESESQSDRLLPRVLCCYEF